MQHFFFLVVDLTDQTRNNFPFGFFFRAGIYFVYYLIFQELLLDCNIVHHRSFNSFYYHFFTRNADKMEAAAAGVSGQRLSTSGSNVPVAAELQNATSGSSKINATGSETGQTGVAGSSNVKATISSTPAASAAVGMFHLKDSLNLWPNFAIFGQVMSCFGCLIISFVLFFHRKLANRDSKWMII